MKDQTIPCKLFDAYTGVPKVALLDFKNGTNPFPLESYVQHVDT